MVAPYSEVVSYGIVVKGKHGRVHSLYKPVNVGNELAVFPGVALLLLACVVVVGQSDGEEKCLGVKLLKHIHLAAGLCHLLLGVRLIPYVIAYGVLHRLKLLNKSLRNVEGNLVVKAVLLHTAHNRHILENEVKAVLFAGVYRCPSAIVASPAKLGHIESRFLKVSRVFVKNLLRVAVNGSTYNCEVRENVVLLAPLEALVTHRIAVVNYVFHLGFSFSLEKTAVFSLYT